MISSIQKDKIPFDYTYVLKTSLLEEVLSDENFNIDITLHYWKPQVFGSIFEVHYWLPNKNVPFNRLYIKAGAISKKDISYAKEGLINEVLPEFIKWMKKIVELDVRSPLNTERYFNACFHDKKIIIEKN